MSFVSLGLMSGSSLDGLDIALTSFEFKEGNYTNQLHKGQTFSYPENILDSLKIVRKLSSAELADLDILLANFFVNSIEKFIESISFNKSIDLIVNHGHTVFHFPDKLVSLQIGNSQYISSKTKIKTLGELRKKDIIYGGSGAPIVPIFDFFCLPEYKYCLNLGGIMNISEKTSDSIISYDVGVCNQILNILASRKGFEYDKDGALAEKGNLYKPLFDVLNEDPFFTLLNPKSLDNSYSTHLLLLIDSFDISTEDKLNTFCHSIAYQVKQSIKEDSKEVYTTGGGAKNKFLINLMKNEYNLKIVIPNEDMIDYKEAIAMSFFGYRYIENKFNVFSSVTGATEDTISGTLFYP